MTLSRKEKKKNQNTQIHSKVQRKCVIQYLVYSIRRVKIAQFPIKSPLYVMTGIAISRNTKSSHNSHPFQKKPHYANL